jgi:hypothetical protein
MRRNSILLLGTACCAGATLLASAQIPRRMTVRDFCVTEGHIGEASDATLVIEDSKTRAVLGWEAAPAAEISFRYLGPTREQSALGSGAVRTQIGLKLRAQDSCNLLYVMWRIVPESRVVVSVKSNPGQHTHAECQNRGYHNLRGSFEEPVPVVEPGSAHSLRAELGGESLTVRADGRVVWEGRLDKSAFQFDGPLGFRTDNGKFALQFIATPTSSRLACPGKTQTE